MKSHPFRIVLIAPNGLAVGDIINFDKVDRCEITKIKSIKFLDKEKMVIIGTCKPIEVLENIKKGEKSNDSNQKSV